MKVFAALVIFLGVTMGMTANTPGDSVAGALVAICGLLCIFWPSAARK